MAIDDKLQQFGAYKKARELFAIPSASIRKLRDTP